MADAKIPYQDPTTDSRDLASQTIPRAGAVGGVAHREEVVIGNTTDNAALAAVMNSTPAGTEYGLVTRPIISGVQSMSGNVAITGNVTVVQSTGTNLHTVVDSGNITADTELPPAGTLSDGMGTQVVPGIAAYNMFFDGSGYDRVSLSRPFPTQEQPVATYITSFSSVAGGAGNCVEIIGSATKTVKVWEVFIEKPTVAATFTLRKQSSASTGGASANQTITPCEDLDGAATAVVKAFTAAPTAGTLVGNIWNTIVATTDREDILFGGGRTKPVTLRGTTQTLAINTTIAGTNNFTIVHTEENPAV
jgi:hypothetical protein